ncbi:hypothetical protein UA08_00009 [Talaromyces atroroseus]|uniref:Isocitrate dehydrogenase [NAD] subunit 1, mitochondrial n=1 Tax=Talaromyces atroroseus TaxID=1441469 RepID=A0A225ART2_TALAT|nr:hypothetical protein UA08_00009 [Talaromyces atroroseus]OKL64291.1 hypothetical protein UA08_00009 [Talaromyces atroroseus]
MAFNCPYCGHNAHSTPMYMTCEESLLCNQSTIQCGLSESDAWLRSQEDELVARFSAYSITHRVEQQGPTNDSKPMTKRIHYASAAAHSFPVSPFSVDGNQNINTGHKAAWAAETDPKAHSSPSVFLPASVDSFDMHMDCELETSDAAADSKRCSFDSGINVQVSTIESVRPVEAHDADAEPYMSLGYEQGHGNGGNISHSHDQNLARGAQLPEEPSTGTPYTPCKDPIYNARSWWEYGGGRHDYRWDCLRERAMLYAVAELRVERNLRWSSINGASSEMRRAGDWAEAILRAASRPSYVATRSMATVQSDIFKPTKYGGKYTVTLIPGDGIGAEVAESVKTIFKADNVPIEWEQVDVSGVDAGNKHSEELFRESIESLRRNKLGLKGILHTPVERSGHQSFNVALRQELDIYASVVLIKNIPGYKTRHENVDLCIIRENTEGEYSGLEHQSVQGVVESLKIITRAKSERIAKFAFGFALANNRKKITCIHKANIMKLADGLFRNTFKKVAESYPTLETNDMIVDNASMQAVSRPQQFDVMVMPNLYGGILSNIGAALVGGPGIVPGCNMGRDVAVFEPGCRHVGLDIKGKDQANPTALILSGSMLLRHLGLDEHANRISKSVYDVISEGKTRTRDMGGEATTHEFTRAVLDKMETF